MASKLRVPLHTQLRDTTPDDLTLQRMWSAVLRRSGGSSRRRRWVWAIPALAAATVLCALLWSNHGARERVDTRPLRLADGATLGPLDNPTGTKPRAVALSDGSQLVLEPGAALEPLDNTATRFEVLLRRGHVYFSVRPGGPRRWVIDSELLTVEVVGTRFTVARAADRTRVEVAEGMVLVRGERVPGRVERLSAGQHLEVQAVPATPGPAHRVPPERAESVQPPLPQRPARLGPRAQARLPAPPAQEQLLGQTQAPAGQHTWKTLADARQFKEAYVALGEQGTREVDIARLPIEELLLLADVARLSGHPEEAVQLLVQVEARFASDPRAALAAFTRGRVEADVLHHPDRAATAFARALGLGMPVALVEDAYWRLVEAHRVAGDRAGVQAAVEQYLARFPAGRYWERMQRMLQSMP